MEVMIDARPIDAITWPDPNESSAEFEARIVEAVELRLARLRAAKVYAIND